MNCWMVFIHFYITAIPPCPGSGSNRDSSPSLHVDLMSDPSRKRAGGGTNSDRWQPAHQNWGTGHAVLLLSLIYSGIWRWWEEIIYGRWNLKLVYPYLIKYLQLGACCCFLHWSCTHKGKNINCDIIMWDGNFVNRKLNLTGMIREGASSNRT